jgi:glycosyltransferase involved in cell wall biosynthesis
MRVLLITLRSDIGGGPKHVYNLASELREKNFADIFIASPQEAPYDEKYKKIALNFCPLPSRSFSFISFLKLVSFCRENKVQVVHSHGRGAGVYSRLLKLLGYQIVHTFHGVHIENNFKSKVKYYIDRLLSYFTDDLIFVSEDEYQIAKSASITARCRCHVIYNGIRLTTEPEFSPCNPILGTLARLSEIKGIDILIDRFRNSKIQKLKLRIAGDGEDKAKLLQLAKSYSIEFLGEVQDPQAFLNTIGIYVSASRREGLPLSVLEALAQKRPCLLSKVPGHIHFINAKVAIGWENQSEFDQGLKDLLENKSIAQEITARGWDFLVKNHSHEEQVRKTAEIYRKRML